MNSHFAQIVLIGIIVTASFKSQGQRIDSVSIKIKKEQKNLDIIRLFHEGKVPVKKFIESGMMAEDIEWFVPGPKDKLPFAGIWRGVDGVTEFSRLLNSTMQYNKVEIKEYIVDGDQVAAIFWGEGIARSTGKAFQSEILRLYSFKDGKIIKVRNFYDTSSYVSALSNE